MNISIFKAIGPIMIGPSSSHTAGAARLSRIARLIVEKPFHQVSFGLHGSFAKTYRGHGTDYALVAGALGLYENDERLANSFALAKQAGIGYDFYETELDGMHENTVKMTFYLEDGSSSEIIGSSIGGGQIVITSINGFATEFTAQTTTLIIRQRDEFGVVSKVTSVLADYGINIGIMKVSRTGKGGTAFCIIETDNRIPDDVVARLKEIKQVIAVQVINILEQGE